jgi:hypothetical protein
VTAIRIMSTDELLAHCGTKELQDRMAFWQHLRHAGFHQRYLNGLLAAGVPAGKAAEIADVARLQIQRAEEGIAAAIYAIKELATEVDDARRRATHAANNGFRV